jgi:Phage tail lysozyme
MAITRSDFAEECVHQGVRFGIHPHYLVAVAELRSGISDVADGDRIGPFRLTQTEWNANCSDEEFGITDFVADDINTPEMQCCIYALMALRAQNLCLAQSGQIPSAVELYREQWPSDQAPLPAALQDALGKTADLMNPAFTAVIGTPVPSPTTIAAGDFAPSPSPDIDLPVPTKGTETFLAKAPGIMAKLIADFGLKDFQAAGLLGNIGEECDGFREMQEKKPLIPGSKGGFGWAQWTGPRRTKFEAFCSGLGLSPFADAANYGFLREELNTSQAMSLTAIQKTASIAKAVRSFEATFEGAKAGLEHFDRRDQWSDLALRSFRASASTMVPSAVAKILDPNLIQRVIAVANSGNASFWAIDQFADEGGQVLVKQESGQNPVILATDTTIFPLKAGLVPTPIAEQLSASFNGAVTQPSPVQVPAPVSDADVSARIFAMAKQCDETLVTRDAPNTNNGRLACAFAVNEVVRRAIGKPVGGGNSTADMGEVLAETQRQVPEQQIAPGMIIISPTHGGNVGHVGIVGEVKNPVLATVIYSNSSARGVFSHSFTLGRWKAFYRDSKGLPVFFYALKS